VHVPFSCPLSSSRLVRIGRAALLSGVILCGGAAIAPPAFAAGVAPGQATPVQREQAQNRFLKGRDSFAKKQYEAALGEFNASLDIVASPNTRLYVGRCLRELGRLVHAYVELGRTEVEAKELSRDDPRYEKAGQSAHDERVKLEPLLGFVNVEVVNAETSTTLKVGGDEVRRGGWSEPIPVMPGTVEITAETPSRAPVKRTVEAKANAKTAVAIDVAEGASTGEPVVATTPSSPPKPSNGGLRNVAYVTGGAALVGLGLFVFFGLKANSTYSDLEKTCNNGPCPPGHEGDISEGRTQQTVANLGLALFGVGAAASVTLWILGGSGSSASTTTAATRGGPRARLDAGPSFVGVRGSF
jgi:hypothetical protein